MSNNETTVSPQAIPEAAPGPETPTSMFAARVAENPDKKIVIDGDRSLTYLQAYEKSTSLAKHLHKLGLKPGDHAAVMTYNQLEHSIIRTALMLLRVGMIMVGYRSKPLEIEYIVENSDSKMLIFYQEFEPLILPFKDRYTHLLPNGFISFGGEKIRGAIQMEPLMENPPDVNLLNLPMPETPAATMIYTSGTTGRPKGAARMRGQRDADSPPIIPGEGGLTSEYAQKVREILKLQDNEIHLICCPIYHSAPFFFAMITSRGGGTRVYQRRFKPEEFLELVAKHKVTSTHLVPTMVIRLLQLPESFTRNLDLSSLRTVICGAAPLFPEFKLAFLDRFGPILYEYYGSTETGVNTLISPEEMRQRPSSVGKALPLNELLIVDEAMNPVPDDKRGVLYIKGPMIMDGYYKNEEETAKTFYGEYLTVGDVAIRDKEGYIYIVDRVKDMIIRGGVNIYPAEIEEVLNTMDGILDVAVVGKPHMEWGEIVVAFIVLDKGVKITEEDIKNYCFERMSNHKIPVEFIFTDEIPRTPTGKILKRELREILKAK